MNKLLSLFLLFLAIACSTNKVPNDKLEKELVEVKNLVTDNYTLFLAPKQEGLLILFPCFPCNAENTQEEFNITALANENNITVLLMNFNLHLWLAESEKEDLENILLDAIAKNEINTQNTFIGGFSGGGNVSLLLTNYLKATDSPLQPKGVFIVDSPIDLLALYDAAQKTIAKDFSEVAAQEANWIISQFDAEFGNGDSSLENYERKSPYVSKTHSLKNISNLEGVQIRFYSEPDTLWWRENRQADYEDMNAYYIAQLTEDLNRKYGDNAVTYIQTENKGYRANGERHPHSWSIVDKEELINWILKE